MLVVVTAALLVVLTVLGLIFGLLALFTYQTSYPGDGLSKYTLRGDKCKEE